MSIKEQKPASTENAPRGEQRPEPVPAGSGRGVWKSLGLTLLSGLLLVGAMPHLDWGWLSWFALVPMLSLFPFRKGRIAFWHGILLGIVYLGGMSYWIIIFAGHLIGPALSTLGWMLVTLYQAFYLGVWALGAQWLRRSPNPWAWRLGVPALWAVIEWWRQAGTLGLSWGDLAYMQHFALPILQVTKLTGIWGLAFLIVLVNVALAEVTHLPASLGVLPKREDEEVRATHFGQNSFPSRFGRGGELVSRGGFPLLTAALVAAAFVYGLVTIQAENLRPTFVAAALQGDIDQNVPNMKAPAYVEQVMTRFLGQCREAAGHGAKLAVWPETAFPGFLLNDAASQQRTAAEAQRDHQAQVIGSAEYDWDQHKSANSVFAMTADGQVMGSYQKRQLVPFGEYVPGVDWLPVLEKLHVTPADLKAGADTQPLLDGGPGIGNIGATICFESSYPRFLREQVARGAGLLVISTDDTWFGRTAEIRQHTAIAAVRAAEMDRYLVRSAATGVSQVIDPTGKVLSEADLFRPAVVWAPVESRATLTPYVRWGDWFVGFCTLLLAAFTLAPWLPRRRCEEEAAEQAEEAVRKSPPQTEEGETGKPSRGFRKGRRITP